jgi:hypothetical protein
MKSRLPIAFAALLLAGANEVAAAPQAAAPRPELSDVVALNLLTPPGEACAGDIARYRAVQDSDVASGNLARSVYNQAKKEIAAAEAECAAGHDAQARADILASRKRHGYPADP